jgi:hypothetical protein
MNDYDTGYGFAKHIFQGAGLKATGLAGGFRNNWIFTCATNSTGGGVYRVKQLSVVMTMVHVVV